MVGQSKTEVIRGLIADGLKPVRVWFGAGEAEEKTANVVAFLRMKQRTNAASIPLSIGVMGFVGYICHVSNIELKPTLEAFAVMAVWLGVAIWNFLRYGGLIREVEDGGHLHRE